MDEELTALAMAADPEAPLSDDAVPLSDMVGEEDGLLPAWYMPSPMAGGRRIRGWRRRVIFLLVTAFLLIEAYGLCSTYGPIGAA